jgi:alcohol dehydrogenase, propanol-preferring
VYKALLCKRTVKIDDSISFSCRMATKIKSIYENDENNININNTNNIDTMLSATIHQYQSPLVLQQTPKPKIIHGEQVLVKVGATGLCHSDLHLVNGDWKKSVPLRLPKIPGHEIAGWIEEIGDSVPEGLLQKGDEVAVFGGWGCGICTQCKNGNEQLCNYAKWPGITVDGGFSEYILVDSYRFLIKIQGGGGKSKLSIEELAPLTDAGLTPYRAIKKIRHTLGPGKVIAVMGIGGLGYYAVQYAKILGQTSDIIALDRQDERLQLAETVGADFTINTSKYEKQKIKEQVLTATNGRGVDIVIDCVGTESTVYNSIRLLNKGGMLVLVGLFGNQITLPLVPTVINEYSIIGSLWGNYNELREVIDLAKKKILKHSIQKFPLNRINEVISLLKEGKIIGRAVIIP